MRLGLQCSPIAFAWSALFFLTLFNTFNALEKVRVVNRATKSAVREYTYVGKDFPQLLNEGHFRPAALLVESTGHYNLSADVEWDSTLPPHNGIFELGPNRRVFALSMYHQLHCLNAMRFTYLLIKGGVANVTSERIRAAFHHSDHCFDLLRQGILCNADITLEYSIMGLDPDGQSVPGGFGDGSIHRCSDWTQIRRYVTEHPGKLHV